MKHKNNMAMANITMVFETNMAMNLNESCE